MIVILCGLPGSGKTTLATGLQRRLAARDLTVDLLHSDDFSRRTYEQLYEHVADAGGDWILDGTFYKREWRNQFYRLDRVFEVWVKASIDTCLRRNQQRQDPISERGVYSIQSEFERPHADLEIDTEALSVEEALDRLEESVVSWLPSDDGDDGDDE
ncbi:AAA family ATPase [Haloparvum sp. AD34]